MKVRVQYMAQLRTLMGASEEHCELAEDSTLAALIEQLAQQRTDAATQLLAATGQVRPSLLAAVNGSAIAAAEASRTLLREGDVVTLLPPIAGG